ncbi:hypothetical protein Tco_0805650 [Tanacetum coccineum]
MLDGFDTYTIEHVRRNQNKKADYPCHWFSEQVRLAGDLGSTNDVLIPLCMTRSSNKDLFQPFENHERVFRSSRKLFKTRSHDHLSLTGFNLISDLEDQFKEEETKAIGDTMEEYMCKTRGDYGSGFSRPKIDDKAHFELKGQFLKELRDNTFSGSDHEDVNEHIDKVLEIVDLFHIPKIPQDQIMIRAFPMSLTGAASRWLRNEPSDADARAAIQDMAEHSPKCHDGTSTRTRKTETSDGLADIQAQLNNLGREIKKVNEKREDNIAQQLQDSTKGTMETLRIKSEDKQWKNL